MTLRSSPRVILISVLCKPIMYLPKEISAGKKKKKKRMITSDKSWKLYSDVLQWHPKWASVILTTRSCKKIGKQCGALEKYNHIIITLRQVPKGNTGSTFSAYSHAIFFPILYFIRHASYCGGLLDDVPSRLKPFLKVSFHILLPTWTHSTVSWLCPTSAWHTRILDHPEWFPITMNKWQ